MRRSLKKWMITAAAAVTALAVCVPVYAAYDKITSVKLVCASFDEPVAGEDIGSITLQPSSNSARYRVTECYYRDEDDDIWERGTVPVVRVVLEVTDEDNYRFGSLSKSKVSVSGCHGEYKSGKSLDSGRGYQLDIKLRKVAGDLTDIDENYWDGKTAVWSEVDDADKYEVRLYRGSRTVTTVTTSANHYNFYPNMTSAGEYSFKVRAISNTDGEKSAWTELSDEYYISSSNVYTGGSTEDNYYSPNSGGPASGGPASGGSNSSGRGWGQNQYGWYYVQGDGNYVRSNWLFVDNNWFLFDANGYMMTGLQLVGNQWFYLNPTSDGTKGAMLTGVQAINGGIYYFNPVSDGSRGAMLTGYQYINNNWYYFDPSNGMLWSNTTTPDGKWIDGAGVVHLN